MNLANDDTWMRRALELAERGRGFVEPNPLVGAVVVRDGQIVSEGWHQKFGGPHAEVHALSAAGSAARGATLVVTLEPCCHFGKTPPCTDAILQAGITRVVAAVRDPNPKVAGGGFAALRQAGIHVEEGVCDSAARRLNSPFFTLITKGRPRVHAKWAMSLDGKITTRAGHSQWISNEASRRIVHQLRGLMDCILVGINTALADDPQLTARPAGARVATRIVLDSQARLPATSKLAATAREVPTLVTVVETAPLDQREALGNLGCEVLILPKDHGHPSLPGLLAELGRRGHSNLLVEGGGVVLGSFLDAGLIDEVHVFLAPKLIGGTNARTPIAGLGAETLGQALSLTGWETRMVEGDVYIHGWRE